MQTFEIPVWPYAYGGPSGRGVIRSVPQDFVVTERLGFEPSGAGEHVFLCLEKTGENTEYVARQLARFAGVKQRDIGYAGLKDRHAVTSQWFSVHLPGRPEPDWAGFESDSVKIRQVVRHARKLKRGALAGNAFELSVRNWRGDADRLEAQLTVIGIAGMPNYFGAQRFGHDGHNIEKALALFAGARFKPGQRSLYLSAVRSYLFNQLLAKRVSERTWNRALAGDALALAGSRSYFQADRIDAVLEQRLEAGTLHPTGVLWGQGGSAVGSEALALEQAVIGAFPELAQGLVEQGIGSDRRALRVNVTGLHWRFADDDHLKLRFDLPAGSYATALLREIIEI